MPNEIIILDRAEQNLRIAFGSRHVVRSNRDAVAYRVAMVREARRAAGM